MGLVPLLVFKFQGARISAYHAVSLSHSL
jgi:hypothetical protein